MEINIDNDIVKYNYNNHMSFFREINEKCKSYIWDLVEEHMDMVYVDIMSNAEIRFGNRKYVRYLTAFQDFSEWTRFQMFVRKCILEQKLLMTMILISVKFLKIIMKYMIRKWFILEDIECWNKVL